MKHNAHNLRTPKHDRYGREGSRLENARRSILEKKKAHRRGPETDEYLTTQLAYIHTRFRVCWVREHVFHVIGMQPVSAHSSQ